MAERYNTEEQKNDRRREWRRGTIRRSRRMTEGENGGEVQYGGVEE